MQHLPPGLCGEDQHSHTVNPDASPSPYTQTGGEYEQIFHKGNKAAAASKDVGQRIEFLLKFFLSV